MNAFFSGCLAGIAYAILLGPLFFAGIHATIRKGKPGGLAVVAGSFFSDLLMAIVGFSGASALEKWINAPAVTDILHLGGGLILTGIGASVLLLRPGINLDAKKSRWKFRPTGYWGETLMGFSINSLNPSNWLFWIGVAAAFEHEGQGWLSVAGALLTVVSADVGKVLITFRIARKLDPKWLAFIIRIGGLIILILGLAVLWRVRRQMGFE
ncbi:MAG: LysE family transporter [Lewinellaceae bacterium]|nr:LysE family transporter [Lewinellaceae bacterium]